MDFPFEIAVFELLTWFSEGSGRTEALAARVQLAAEAILRLGAHCGTHQPRPCAL